ncbi:unnamed protein product [Rhizoctonia solani]|uniref:Phosphatidic acid phosphatase type 2/haloperoxidase domain-containing protein n=1 Tax=Rhizoctonia solani TaxID=456999 RepID=A0A8H3DHS4_9AGAM|nr:unnamed protein product [Rhizoctonia solani]
MSMGCPGELKCTGKWTYESPVRHEFLPHPTHETDMEDTPQQTNRKRLAFIDHIPTLRQYIQDTWLDLLVVICVGALALGLNGADNASTRQFPIVFREDGDTIYPLFTLLSPTLAGNPCTFRPPPSMYVRQPSVFSIPIWLDALLAILIPTLFFFIAQIRVRYVLDSHTPLNAQQQNQGRFMTSILHSGGLYGLFHPRLCSRFLSRPSLGGFGPTFSQASPAASSQLIRNNPTLAVCNPDLSKIGTGSGFQGIMYDISICSPDANKAHLRDAIKSFPSGHTTAAAAGYVYLSLYFNAKMKIFSNERPHFYKLLIFLAPLLGASLIGGVLTVDNSHHWYDVIAGAIIGATGAFAAFRMSYASIWDYRFNHIPLPRPKSAWSPFETPTHDGHANGSAVEAKFNISAPKSFTYTTGVPLFPSFAHQKDWCPAGAPGDAWTNTELNRADADIQLQRFRT